ncbi:Sulfite exporter TauE/SafE [Chitinophaga sp. YR627]|uniref:urease accessory protein UreH domain-containing protein n=1 Tax=Chitinophaga sp. YR627 TaxID=1881041 RepID=UPI0008E2CE4A|nr:sulfite exporter TauE/SafE family protein [Chitinophaga sp. YR627]SFN51769.1 Sulfite exporter TauE/SafE [Chitinophaga sp. YR627]
MDTELQVLILTAITISCLHTVTGPDHYIPFIALSRVRGWKIGKTVAWTLLCGIAHVGSSVLLGLLGIGLGWSLSRISGVEDLRGGLAGWALLTFGLLYTIWGLKRAWSNKVHKHFDVYDNGEIYVYEHKHGEIVYPQERMKVTPWVMLIIFGLGPCEPLIPLLTYPAAQHSTYGMTLLIVSFTLFTLLTMTGMVLLGYYGFSVLKTSRLERYVHALGGLTILICGIGMVYLGW